MRGHSPNITSKVEDILVFVKGHFPAMKPREIRTHILQHLEAFDLKESQVPRVRSIQNKLNKPENRTRIEKIKSDALNQPWNVGLGMKYGISPGIVPVLLRITRIETEAGGDELTYDVTVRKALWVDYLYPTVDEILRRRRPKLNAGQRAWVIYSIAEQYAKLDELEETSNGKDTGKPALDTTDLDFRFLVKEDVSNKSIGDAGAYVRLPEFARVVSSLVESDRILTIKEHPLTRSELGDYFKAAPQKKIDQLNRQLQKDLEKSQLDSPR